MTGLRPDALRVPVADPAGAAAFYARVLGGAEDGAAGTVVLPNGGTIEFVEAEPLSPGFGGAVMTGAFEQPAEVRAVMDTAAAQGARILKPAKKALFGSFAGSFRAPDGLIWKIASDKGRDTAPAAAEPRPAETALILGVRDPKASKGFYTALGMEPDRDYGSTYIDFAPAEGSTRLCLMQSPALAKDVGAADREGAPGFALVHRSGSRAEWERLASAPGWSRVAGSGPEDGGADPDGFRWVIAPAEGDSPA